MLHKLKQQTNNSTLTNYISTSLKQGYLTSTPLSLTVTLNRRVTMVMLGGVEAWFKVYVLFNN